MLESVRVPLRTEELIMQAPPQPAARPDDQNGNVCLAAQLAAAPKDDKKTVALPAEEGQVKSVSQSGSLARQYCERPRFKRWFPLTFVMCIIWIGSLSYVVAWAITVLGDTLRIPDSVMGITFLAAGTSVPEAVSSVIVAKQDRKVGIACLGMYACFLILASLIELNVFFVVNLPTCGR
ncbi:hypothetical protein B566_EDAN011140 [Ephemera danica]|nr:hypothetical protein B566_EDAN011140 [Ephemera danica]